MKVSGLTAVARELSSGGVVLCYHNVIANTVEWGGFGLHMPVRAFERQISWLAANYDVVALEELVDARSRRGMAAVTFDDGYDGVFNHAWPLLKHLNIPATVFIVADAPERADTFWWDHHDVQKAYSPSLHQYWLSALRGDGATIVDSIGAPRHVMPPPADCRPARWQTIADAVTAARGLRVGVHSATHRALPEVDDLELCREVVESRDIIARRIGVTPEVFAYPYGLWNDRVRAVVRAAGYKAACTLDYGHNTAAADPWTLRRVNVPAGIRDAAFQAWTAGIDIRRRRTS